MEGEGEGGEKEGGREEGKEEGKEEGREEGRKEGGREEGREEWREKGGRREGGREGGGEGRKSHQWFCIVLRICPGLTSQRVITLLMLSNSIMNFIKAWPHQQQLLVLTEQDSMLLLAS